MVSTSRTNTISEDLIFNAGVRYDEYGYFGGTTNPRLALIYNPFEKTTFKLIYGSAFRPPNDFELYYGDGITQKGNPDLKPETITTYEMSCSGTIHRQILAYFNIRLLQRYR